MVLTDADRRDLIVVLQCVNDHRGSVMMAEYHAMQRLAEKLKTDEDEEQTRKPMRCPRCQSPSPERHPAMQWEGEVQLCRDPWHQPHDHMIRADAPPRPDRKGDSQ